MYVHISTHTYIHTYTYIDTQPEVAVATTEPGHKTSRVESRRVELNRVETLQQGHFSQLCVRQGHLHTSERWQQQLQPLQQQQQQQERQQQDL